MVGVSNRFIFVAENEQRNSAKEGEQNRDQFHAKSSDKGLRLSEKESISVPAILPMVKSKLLNLAFALRGWEQRR